MGHHIKNLVKVNVRVSNLEDAVNFFEETLGASLIENRGNATIGDFDGATVNLGGAVLDLVAPNKPDSVLAKNIEKRGQGLDSIAFEVENIEDTAAHLASKGINVINRHEIRGHKVAFIHPKDAYGVLVELIQRNAV